MPRHLGRAPLLRGPVAVAAALILLACGAQTEPAISRGVDQPAPQETLIDPVAPLTPAAPPPRRPNLLVIETDDMRADDLEWMPNVQRLIGDRGLRFENSFSPYPLCCPARASFLNGRYAHNHGVLSHTEPYGFASFDDRRTIATVLQKAGYRTALVGKYLNGYGEQPLRPSGRSSLTYVPPGWDRWLAGSDHAWLPWDDLGGNTYDYFSLTQNIDGRLESFPGRYATDVMAEQVRRVTTRFGREGRPWFVWWTPVAPHHGSPVEPDDPGRTVRSDGSVTDWVTPARPNWVKGRFDDRITQAPGMRLASEGSSEADVEDKPRYLRKLPELTTAERDALTTVARQRAEAMFVLDVQIGRTVSRLGRTGQLDDTVLMFTSDNGYYLGEHRKRQGKINLHEPSLRVPLLISGPGVPRGRRYDPVTAIDLAPTLASLAGTRMPRSDGLDLTDLIFDGDRGWDRPVITEGMMPEGRYAELRRLGPSPLNTRGLRLGRWKLTRYSTGETELYDLAADPLELRNLARDPEHAEVVSELRRLWRSYARCQGQECLAELPARWRLTAEESRRLTERQQREAARYFGS